MRRLQKPRARLPEVLACVAALRFKRANGRKRGGAGLPRLLLNRGLNPFLGGVLDECGSEHSKSSRGHFFLKNDPRSLFGFHFPSTRLDMEGSEHLLLPVMAGFQKNQILGEARNVERPANLPVFIN